MTVRSMQKLIGPFGATYEVKDTDGVASLELDGVAVAQASQELTAATTLTAADSGKTLYLNLTAGFATTLPAPADGLKFKFVLSAAITGDMTIVTNASANIIQGTVIVNGASVVGANEDTITFANAAETVGDFVELESDGTNWWITGVAAAAGGITLTAT